MNKKRSSGFITLGVGIISLIITFLIYKFVKIDDVFSIILMTMSLVIGVFGIFQIIRDAYN